MAEEIRSAMASEPMFLDRTSFFVLLQAWLCFPNDGTLHLLCAEALAHIDFLVQDQDEEGEKDRGRFFLALAKQSVVAWNHLLAYLIEVNDMTSFLHLKQFSPFQGDLVVEVERGSFGLRVCKMLAYEQWFMETYGKTSGINTLIISQPRMRISVD